MGEHVAYIVRAEGVNFAATLDDTQDLSTIRGSSLALLAIGDAVEAALARAGASDPRRIFVGASQAAYGFRAPAGAGETVRNQVAAALAARGPNGEPFDHLSFVVDVVEGNDQEALDRAEAHNRARQFRQWTVPLPSFLPSAAGFDSRDRARPAVEKDREAPGEADGEPILVSPSVAARRSYGRRMRQAFYRTQAKDAAEGLAFCDSFQDIVGDPPEGLPLSLPFRMALVYADGNGFGAIRDRLGAEAFSTILEPLRQELLRRVLAWYHAGLNADARRFAFAGDDGEARLRLETLLWGGDELMFVMPSWLVFDFLEGFFDATAGWMAGREPLTHSVGVVVCHHKVPIRQARALAKDIADALKEAARERDLGKRNAMAIEIFESLMPPQDGLSAYRSRLYGTTEALALDLAFPGEGFAELRERCRVFAGKGESVHALPRSQLSRALGAARNAGPSLAAPAASEAAERTLADYARRVRGSPDFAAMVPALPRLAGTPPRPLALELALLAGVWDYADPFVAAPSPTFPNAAGPS